jgi:hypothetical protein
MPWFSLFSLFELKASVLYHTSGNANMCSFHMVFEGLISQCSVDGQLEFASLFSTIISLPLKEVNHPDIFECQSISYLIAFFSSL